jgi:secreted PhoX family phosphatase
MLNRPVFVALDPDGNVCVTDFLNRVVKFTATGEFVSTWGTAGNGAGQLSDPAGIAIARNGHVFVVDHGNNRIEEFTPDGVYVTAWGTTGSGSGQFSIPHGLSLDAAGHLYVADDGNARVQVLTSEGGFLDAWGTLGSGAGQFGSDSPTDVTVNRFSEVFVVDRANCRIEKFRDLAIPTARRTWTSVKAMYR